MTEKIFRFSKSQEILLPSAHGIVIGSPDMLRPMVSTWLSDIIATRTGGVRGNFFCGRYVFPGETLSKESKDTYNRVCQIPLPPSDGFGSSGGYSYSFPTGRLIAAVVPFKRPDEDDTSYYNRIVIRPDTPQSKPVWFYLEDPNGRPRHQTCKAHLIYDNGNVIVKIGPKVVETITPNEEKQ
jgi:hypothetical protein